MYFKQLTSLVIALILFTSSGYSSDSPRFHDLTIVVNSCDKYNSLWDGFFTLLFNQWPTLKTTNKDVPIILISNTSSYPDPRGQAA